jgi:hypothetical protein
MEIIGLVCLLLLLILFAPVFEEAGAELILGVAFVLYCILFPLAWLLTHLGNWIARLMYGPPQENEWSAQEQLVAARDAMATAIGGLLLLESRDSRYSAVCRGYQRRLTELYRQGQQQWQSGMWFRAASTAENILRASARLEQAIAGQEAVAVMEAELMLLLSEVPAMQERRPNAVQNALRRKMSAFVQV